ncbi:GPR1/FUN34/YaaH-class plasma membrane protein-like protein [Usnea florida]
MSTFYLCSKNHSIVGQMDTYLAFHRDSRHKKTEEHEKSFNPPLNTSFPSRHNVSEEDVASDEAINKIRTANSVTISPELFEKIYLNPQNAVKGELRNTFANPTPLALLGFLLSLSPLSCELMGWRGAGVDGIATVGAYYFIGGFLMSLGGILEFFLGNTFSFVVFCSFGGFWFTLGSTLTPSFNAYGAYAADPNQPTQGLTSPGFHASFGFFLLFMGLMSLIYLICALRTNIVFVAIFLGLLLTFVVLTGSYWQLARGNIEMSQRLQVAAGAFGFLATLAGWWIFFAQMLASVDFPFQIPVGDISHLITPLSERVKQKERYPA